MAGSSVTVTRTSKDVGHVKNAEVVISLACVSDDTNGLIPNQTFAGLKDYVLTEVQPIPDGVAPLTSAFEIRFEDANGEAVFLSASIAVDSKAPIGGHTTLGWYPRIDDSNTFKIVDPADHTSTISVGNSKEMDVILRFEKKQG